MNSKIEKLIEELSKKNKTISTMESCTGGALANAITSVSNASKIINFGAVTYSNEYKVKMGVNQQTIDKYSVYSIEVAKEMSKSISLFANSNYGVGITGKLNKKDINNMFGKDNVVYISIYDKDNDKYYEKKLKVNKKTRILNKNYIINNILDSLITIIN